MIQRRLLHTSLIPCMMKRRKDPSDVLRSNVKPRGMFSEMGRKFLLMKWDQSMGMDKDFKTKSQMIYLSNSMTVISFIYNPVMIGMTSLVGYFYATDTCTSFMHTVALGYLGLMTAAFKYGLYLAPVRIYYNEEKDQTIGIFAHSLIPFRLVMKELPQHSFRKSELLYSNGKMDIFVESENFRSKEDLQRLLVVSQKKSSS